MSGDRGAGIVLCDSCGADHTGIDVPGGLLFETKAICPECAPSWMESIVKYGEERFIRDRARSGESFRQFVLRIRAQSG